jgi:membrane-associated PAP2 superfamily phosphatase
MSFNDIWERKKLWRSELIILIILWCLTFILFFATNLDIEIMRYFYIDGKWPVQYQPLWGFFYHASPIFAGIIAIGSIAFIIFASINAKYTKYRIHALFILLSLALGAGLTVNAILKDHWGRPRPRQIREFNGNYNYTKPFVIGSETEGKSFPCGHSSVGFTYGVLWFIFRRKNKYIAITSLFGAIILGTLIGTGRMAAGGHFPSDVVWSGIIPYTISFFLYYFILNIPLREEIAEKTTYKPVTFGIKQAAIYGCLAGIAIFSVLLATPYKRDINYKIKEFSENATLPAMLSLEIEKADILIDFDKKQSEPIIISGDATGFGLPWSKIRAIGKIHADNPSTNIVYKVYKKGIFTDIESNINISLNPDYFNKINIKQKQGALDIKNEKLGTKKDLEISIEKK